MIFGQSSAGIALRQRGDHLVLDAGARRGEEALVGERLHPLDHHAAHHLDRRGGADLGTGDRYPHGKIAAGSARPRSACGPASSIGVWWRAGWIGAMTATST